MTSIIHPVGLTCEYRVNPIGMDVRRPRLSWRLHSTDPSATGLRQTAWRILIASTADNLSRDIGDLWDSGKTAGDDSLHIEYTGAPLMNEQWCYWKVGAWDQDDTPSNWSEPAYWSMGLMGPGWTLPHVRDESNRISILPAPPKWIGAARAQDERDSSFLPAVMVRKQFPIEPPIAGAMLYASALGVYDVHVNGKRIGNQVLAPEWTDYRQRAQYQAFDVTDAVKRGENVIAATVAPGWYAGQLGLAMIDIGGRVVGHYGRHPRFIACLRVFFEDSAVQTVITDHTWRCSTEGPVRRADLLAGETYDGRMEQSKWNLAGFDASDWTPVVTALGPNLSWQPNEPIRITEHLKPVRLTEPKPGVHVFDMGQNMVGWVRMKIRGNVGDDIRLRHAEMVIADGTIYRDNLRFRGDPTYGAQQEDHFICADKGKETFEPRFTYHGFRYVEVVGLSYTPSLNDLIGCVIHSDSLRAGAFESSCDLLNRIHAAVYWTQRGNLHSVPTDCPQRDERLGWMGDMLIFCQTAIFNMDMGAFLTKWLRDVTEAQARDGRFPEFAPHPFSPDVRFSGNPGWADAGVIIPWNMFVNYADTRILESMYEASERFIAWAVRMNPDLTWRDQSQIGWWFCDWLNSDSWVGIKGVPPTGGAVDKTLFSTAFLAHSTQTLARVASQLGKTDDAAKWAALAANIRSAFCREFLQSDGRLLGDTQAAYALALHFDLLPADVRSTCLNHLLTAIERVGGRLSTGIHGTIRLMLELVSRGHADKAYEQIMRTAMPSWGYMVEQGATTIWERWDSYVADRGFQNVGMNSFNHCALGAVGEWMIRVIGGLNPDENAPGWKHFSITPVPGGGLTWADVRYDSIRGLIESAWRIEDGRFTLRVQVPASTTATVRLPYGGDRIEIGSGRHTFEQSYTPAINRA